MAINFALTEASQTVLTALATKPAMCIHQLQELTQIPFSSLRRILVVLCKEGITERIYGESKNERLIRLVNFEEVSKQYVDSPTRLPELFGLEEEVAMHRVMMLRRFRDRLHCELHPLLNVVIADYERGLKAVQRHRGDDIDDY